MRARENRATPANRPGDEQPSRPSRVLLVEDEPNILELLTSSLELGGFSTRGAPDAETALACLNGFDPDIAVVDVSLPGRSGLELVADLRGLRTDLPVLFLTARDTLQDRLAGLRARADDHVTEPLSLEEVVLRIRASLRRSTGAGEDGDAAILRYADLELDEAVHEVRRAGVPVALSPTEYALLRYLLLNSGSVVSKSQILEQVWGGPSEDTRVVELYISYLRRKVDTGDTRLIRTQRSGSRLPAATRQESRTGTSDSTCAVGSPHGRRSHRWSEPPRRRAAQSRPHHRCGDARVR